LTEIKERLAELQAGQQQLPPDWQEEGEQLRQLRLHLDRGLRGSFGSCSEATTVAPLAASAQNRTLMSVESEVGLNTSSMERLGKHLWMLSIHVFRNTNVVFLAN
jgi:hypothetical protein